ncbi:hypothetical protein OAO01_09140, partial [Oligoflexia bacterium]|nr:hypothetical protein [Oligoflexia bacterium]
DAVHGIERKFKVVRWGEYNAARRHNPSVSILDYTDIVKLKYERLPGYEHLSQKEYSKLMQEKLEKRRQKIVAERYALGLGFAGKTALLRKRRGSVPRSTKRSDLNSHRPRVLSICNKRRAECKAWYFKVYFEYKEASLQYREGEDEVSFPPGTYPPAKPAHPPPPTT